MASEFFNNPHVFTDYDGLYNRIIFPEFFAVRKLSRDDFELVQSMYDTYYDDESDSDDDILEEEDDAMFLISENNWVPSSDFYSKAVQVKWSPVMMRQFAGLSNLKSIIRKIKQIPSSNTKVGSCWGSCVCMYSSEELRELVRDLGIKGTLNFNKDQMCALLNLFSDNGLVELSYPFLTSDLDFLYDPNIPDRRPSEKKVQQEAVMNPDLKKEINEMIREGVQHHVTSMHGAPPAVVPETPQGNKTGKGFETPEQPIGKHDGHNTNPQFGFSYY